MALREFGVIYASVLGSSLECTMYNAPSTHDYCSYCRYLCTVKFQRIQSCSLYMKLNSSTHLCYKTSTLNKNFDTLWKSALQYILSRCIEAPFWIRGPPFLVFSACHSSHITLWCRNVKQLPWAELWIINVSKDNMETPKLRQIASHRYLQFIYSTVCMV